jgi:methionyl-tRNA formyltransferase
MKMALCSSDFLTPVHHSIRDAGHQVSHVFSSCDLESGWSLQTAQFAKEMRAQFVVGAVTEEHVHQMIREGVEVLVSAAYDHKIPVPGNDQLKCINFHPTLLPEGRGGWPGPHILLRHPEAAGLTLHTMTNRWDYGDILLQEKIRVSDKDDSDSFVAKVVQLSGKLSKELWANFEKIWAGRSPMTGKGSYWKKPTEADRTITPQDDPQHIASIFRAFGNMTLFSDGNSPAVPVSKVVVWEAENTEPVGTLVAFNKLQRIYALRNGFLSVSGS